MDTSSILKMIGALGSAVGGVSGSFGGSASATSMSPATAPTMDQLTLNPQLMGESPRIPYDFGQGQDTLAPPPATQPPNLPPGQAPELGPDGKPKKTWQEQVTELGKVISSVGKAGQDVQNSPLAQRMFQENSQAQITANQMNAKKIDQFRRHDLSSQILEKYGLL